MCVILTPPARHAKQVTAAQQRLREHEEQLKRLRAEEQACQQALRDAQASLSLLHAAPAAAAAAAAVAAAGEEAHSHANDSGGLGLRRGAVGGSAAVSLRAYRQPRGGAAQPTMLGAAGMAGGSGNPGCSSGTAAGAAACTASRPEPWVSSPPPWWAAAAPSTPCALAATAAAAAAPGGWVAPDGAAAAPPWLLPPPGLAGWLPAALMPASMLAMAFGGAQVQRLAVPMVAPVPQAPVPAAVVQEDVPYDGYAALQYSRSMHAAAGGGVDSAGAAIAEGEGRLGEGDGLEEAVQAVVERPPCCGVEAPAAGTAAQVLGSGVGSRAEGGGKLGALGSGTAARLQVTDTHAASLPAVASVSGWTGGAKRKRQARARLSASGMAARIRALHTELGICAPPAGAAGLGAAAAAEERRRCAGEGLPGDVHKRPRVALSHCQEAPLLRGVAPDMGTATSSIAAFGAAPAACGVTGVLDAVAVPPTPDAACLQSRVLSALLAGAHTAPVGSGGSASVTPSQALQALLASAGTLASPLPAGSAQGAAVAQTQALQALLAGAGTLTSPLPVGSAQGSAQGAAAAQTQALQALLASAGTLLRPLPVGTGISDQCSMQDGSAAPNQALQALLASVGTPVRLLPLESGQGSAQGTAGAQTQALQALLAGVHCTDLPGRGNALVNPLALGAAEGQADAPAAEAAAAAAAAAGVMLAVLTHAVLTAGGPCSGGKGA